jgi:hypothetical protein
MPPCSPQFPELPAERAGGQPPSGAQAVRAPRRSGLPPQRQGSKPTKPFGPPKPVAWKRKVGSSWGAETGWQGFNNRGTTLAAGKGPGYQAGGSAVLATSTCMEEGWAHREGHPRSPGRTGMQHNIVRDSAKHWSDGPNDRSGTGQRCTHILTTLILHL